jgi:SAM-dependent methyltransferase
MLRAAGLLTLDLATALLDENRGLKDATPLNVLFDGARPVFVDALSVEDREAASPVWLAYGQFVRTFILPFIASRHLGWSLRRTFTGSRDGLTPEELYRTLDLLDLVRPGVVGFVSGPVVLGRLRKSRYSAPHVDERRAKFVLRSVLSHLRHALERLGGDRHTSRWTSYRDPEIHAPDYHATRLELVGRLLRSYRPDSVLDVGTNDGVFASLAARLGANVVAIDRDEAVVDHAFRRVHAAGERVLPLVVDLADPTPGTGWRNAERASFLDRAGSGFDCVLCLAVLHHFVIGDWLPLAAVMELMATLARKVLIAEFVPADDLYCVRLAAGRTINREQWSIEAFEAAALRHFTIESRHDVGDCGRTLLVLRRHAR